MPGPKSNDCCPVDIEVVSVFKPSENPLKTNQKEVKVKVYKSIHLILFQVKLNLEKQKRL